MKLRSHTSQHQGMARATEFAMKLKLTVKVNNLVLNPKVVWPKFTRFGCDMGSIMSPCTFEFLHPSVVSSKVYIAPLPQMGQEVDAITSEKRNASGMDLFV